MENGGKLKTKNNVYNEEYDDGKFDVQLRKQVRGVIISQRSIIYFLEKGLWNRHSRISHMHIDGAALFQKAAR